MNIEKLSYLGKSDGCEHVFAEVREGVIARIYHYDLVEGGCGNALIYLSGMGFGTKLTNGKKVREGLPAKVRKVPKSISQAIECDVGYCDSCGQAWACDDLNYPNADVRMTDDGIKCVACLTAQDQMREFTEARDLFRARNVEGIDWQSEGFEEVETLFCDSSGFGGPGERALTRTQAESEAERILSENQGSELFCGLTGIGQFQVYVTVFKRSKRKGKK